MSKTSIETYEFFNTIVEILENEILGVAIELQKDENENYKIVLLHPDENIEEYTIVNFNHLSREEAAQANADNMIKYHMKFLKKKYHLNNGVFPTQFKKETVKKIERLTKKVLKGKYDGIEIENTSYSTHQFDNQIIKLSRTRGNLRSKSEPIIYISLYEFYYSTLFNLIYCGDLDTEINPEWANDWTDINSDLVMNGNFDFQ